MKTYKIIGFVVIALLLLAGTYYLGQHQYHPDIQLATENNNPGLLRNSSDKLLTFNTPIDGKAALYNYLTSIMTGTTTTGIGPYSSIVDFSKAYASVSNTNNPLQYAANLANQLKVSPDTQLKSLIPRIDDFATAIANNNGFNNR